MRKTNTLLSILTLLALGCAGPQKQSKPAPKPAAKAPAENGGKRTAATPAPKPKLTFAADIAERLAQFSPTDIDFDDKNVSAETRKVLVKLVQAARVIDQIFLDQVSSNNRTLRARLVAQKAPQPVLDYFDIMYGPWDRLKGDKPFIGTTAKPKGAGYYPIDISKAELEKWIATHPDDAKAFKGYFTLVRRDAATKALRALPYASAFKSRLAAAAKLLEQAAALTSHAGLKKYLSTRAKALLSNDYYESDIAWVELGPDSPIEVVIGPYEVYEDKLMGWKAAFEAYINLPDRVYSKRLQKLAKYNKGAEAALPLPRKYKTRRGTRSPIRVVVQVFTAGDTRAAVQTAAFNLPNDERVRAKVGSKKVLLKNISEAKFNKVLIPIAKRVVAEKLQRHLTFDAYFTDILLHEIAHGMGPGRITVNGKKTTVNRALKELYSRIEECKADIVGLVNGAYLIKRGALSKDLRVQLPAVYLAGVFRALRFGTEEAHARAVLLAFNYLAQAGAITRDKKSGRYTVHNGKFWRAVRKLARLLMMTQGKGDYDAAKKLLDKYGHASAELKASLSKLAGIPVDIRPRYTIERKMQGWK
ncbi:MAG: hypothetical protein KC503_06285 [Myxococcales bacterium]|nr:hypothetical protein [Myxococcales bacterium]